MTLIKQFRIGTAPKVHFIINRDMRYRSDLNSRGVLLPKLTNYLSSTSSCSACSGGGGEESQCEPAICRLSGAALLISSLKSTLRELAPRY